MAVDLPRYQVARSELGLVADTYQIADGILEQIGTLDQFSPMFQPLVHKYKASSALCGYFSVANALLLARTLPSQLRLSPRQLEMALEPLLDYRRVSVELERVMSSVYDQRRAYVVVHRGAFTDERAVQEYFSDWVANYEISDYLLKEAACGVLPTSVHFLRFNQMPEVGKAEHEELERMSEEMPFGKALQEGVNDKESCELEPTASRYIIEVFSPERQLVRPETWLGRHHALEPCVFVVDVNGHFVVAMPLIEDVPGQEHKRLLVLNSSHANYLRSRALAFLFDLCVQKCCGS